jgi:sucrose-6-phosphate hydrolase SacC (GH32 family)
MTPTDSVIGKAFIICFIKPIHLLILANTEDTLLVPTWYRWRDLPLAIYPGIEDKCFSGSILVEEDRVIVFYHGTSAGNMVAISEDPLLLNWEKIPGNPVIPMMTADKKGYPYRVYDPCIWKEKDGNYALSGSYWQGLFSTTAAWYNICFSLKI